MSEVIKIGIAKSKSEEIQEVTEINLSAGKGIIGDRYFHEKNEDRNQLTLIESENIDYYNNKFNLKIPYLNFRRNIVTKGIKLNDLVGKKIIIGKTETKGIDLCRPCKPLQENLGKDNIVKEFLRMGGLRCAILTSSIIKVGDEIKIL
jgi:MOSC domain-containing protein YiiM